MIYNSFIKLHATTNMAGAKIQVNRTRGFVNQNRFKSGRAIKRLKQVTDKHNVKRQTKKSRAAGDISPGSQAGNQTGYA